jgi:hypothetical protein
METYNLIFKPKELRDQAVTVRLPKSASNKLKEICAKSSRSQSEVVEVLINDLWDQLEKKSSTQKKKHKVYND